MPIWFHLGRVPLELFTQIGISYISSALGRPLYMDKVTTYQERLAYAKVCVEINVDTVIPRFVDVRLRDGFITLVKVEVLWLPTKCMHCRTFSHSENDYLMLPKQKLSKVWVPKTKDGDSTALALSKHVIDLGEQSKVGKGEKVMDNGNKVLPEDLNVNIGADGDLVEHQGKLRSNTSISSGKKNAATDDTSLPIDTEQTSAFDLTTEKMKCLYPKKIRATTIGVAVVPSHISQRRKLLGVE
ncbi:hypothetical protein REPUB_Repub02eG0044600 [Reevesia pubescens]